MRVLIIGGMGYIGSHLRERIPYPFEILDAKMGEDLMDYQYITRHLDCDKVVHLANDWQNPQNNVMMALKLLDCFSPDKIVFTSSAAVYGSGRNLKETDQTNPISPYGQSKVDCENVLRGAKILRLFNVYGGGYGIVDLLKNRLNVVVYGNGTQVRDYVYIETVVNSIIYALSDSVNPGIYNVGTGVGTSINEIINMLGVSYKVTYDESKYDMVGAQESVANTEKYILHGFPESIPLSRVIQWKRKTSD